MNRNKSIVVFGGTGYYGRHIVESLIKKEEKVRVLSRDEKKARKVLGELPEIIQGDISNIAVIKKTLSNAKSVIISVSALNFKMFNKMKQIERDAVLDIITECETQTIDRLIYVSGYQMRPDILKKLKIERFGEVKIEVENRIKKSTLNWTILGDAPSFEIFFTFLKGNKMVVPGGGLKKIPCISAIDVGEITAQAIMREDLSGERIRLTGPEALSFPEVAERISLTTGKRITHKKIPLFIIYVLSFLLLPFNPFFRFIYWSLVLLNNFPDELSSKVPEDHKRLLDIFDYSPVTIEDEIKHKLL